MVLYGAQKKRARNAVMIHQRFRVSIEKRLE